WQQRGSESTARGKAFEEAVRARNIEKIEADLGRAIRPNEDELVPIGTLRSKDDLNTPLSAQHGGGAGFDDVLFQFSGEEEAHIIIVEAKDYTGNLTLGDFSAITANLGANLDMLREAIESSTLSDSRKELVRAAIQQRKISLE